MRNKMPPEQQVCAPKQAEKLIELLGENTPESLWIWLKKVPETKWTLRLFSSLGCHPGRWKKIPAYSGDELGALFPSINYKDEKYEFEISKWQNTFHASYTKWDDTYLRKEIASKYEAHAKADLAILGLEEGFIRPENFKYEN